LIDVAELQTRLGSGDLVLVDCRFNLLEPDAGKVAWKTGHIPGAVYAHLDDDLARPAQPGEGRHPLPVPDDFGQTLGRLGIARSSAVVAYDDQGGAIAARLWWMLGWIGHERRYLLDGGLKAWEAAELPLESGVTERPALNYGTVAPNDAMVASTDEIAAQVSGDADHALLDARAAIRYRGEAEPIDSVAGHVPGAVNLAFNELLDAEGRFLPSGGLRQAFADALGPDGETSNVVAMCGSGVTACHLLAGLAALGRDGRLYVGSWSEWIRDPARPIATET
jgi:thiosulfate/3-mercaptopyruvate sulfurtransferase